MMLSGLDILQDCAITACEALAACAEDWVLRFDPNSFTIAPMTETLQPRMLAPVRCIALDD